MAGAHWLERSGWTTGRELGQLSFPNVQNPNYVVCRRFYSVVCFPISFPILVHGKIASKNVHEQKNV